MEPMVDHFGIDPELWRKEFSISSFVISMPRQMLVTRRELDLTLQHRQLNVVHDIPACTRSKTWYRPTVDTFLTRLDL